MIRKILIFSIFLILGYGFWGSPDSKTIAAYTMPMLVFGVIMIFQKDSKRLEGGGWVLVGLGLLFLGIAHMKEGFETVGEE
jgi:Na+/phosphate symporter